MQLHYLLFDQGELLQGDQQKQPLQQQKPMIIIPGLFGSSVNWRSFGKAMSQACPVYLIDQRNHGRSPHADSHSYQDMVQDLLDFINQHKLDNVVLCGHSMGGKVAMLFALLHPQHVGKLIVLDIAPVVYQQSHAPFLEALLTIDLSTLQSRSEANCAVAEAIPDTATRLFLLQSLVGSSGNYQWRLNLSALYKYMSQIIGFPDKLVTNKQCLFPCLFLYGELSDYVKLEYHEKINRYFPSSQIEPIKQAAHWLHVQQPELVLNRVKQFLKDDR